MDELTFPHAERRIYDSIFKQAKSDFDRLDAGGLVGKNYTHILAMLMRLRRAVLHPSLVLSSDEDAGKAASTQGKGKKKLDLDLLHAALIQVCLAPLPANVLARLGLYRTVGTLAEMHCDNHIGEVANAVADEWQMLYGVTALTTSHEDEL